MTDDSREDPEEKKGEVIQYPEKREKDKYVNIPPHTGTRDSKKVKKFTLNPNKSK